MPKKANQSAPQEPGFDERLEQLEQIVGALEEGGLELEVAIERYREGVQLLKGCRELLSGYRQQVEELGAQAEDAVRPYTADPDVGGA